MNGEGKYAAPKVSVLVAAYNVEDCVERAVTSAMKQTLRDIEIIVVDDGSSDGTARVLSELAEKDDRVIVLQHEENRGLMRVRKTGVDAARGAYIMFLDADDELTSDACETAWRAAVESGVDIFQFGTEVVSVQALHGEAEHEAVQAHIQRFLPFVKPHEGRLMGSEVLTGCYLDHKYGYSIWNKIYKRTICVRAYQTIPDENIVMEEDRMGFFFMAFFAQSYQGCGERVLYRYTFGSGVSTQQEITYQTARHVIPVARQIVCIRDFLEREHALGKYGYIYERMLEDAERNARGYMRQLIAKQPPATAGCVLELYIQNYGLAALAENMIETYFWEPGRFFECLQYAPSAKKCTGKRSRVIGTFYHRLHNGGVERVLSHLIPIWHRMGYRIVLFTDDTPNIEDYEIDVPYTRVCLPAFDWRDAGKHYNRRAQTLKDAIREYEVDTMVYHAWISNYQPWDMLVCQGCGCRFLVHSHINYDFCRFSPLETKQLFVQFPAVFALADGVITLSEVDIQFWKNINPNVYCVTNPTDDRYLGAYEGKRHCRDILWLARFEPIQKQPMEAVKIAHEVIKRVPNARLHMVGGSGEAVEQAQKRQVEAYIRKNHLENSIFLHGFQRDVEPYYAQADVFLMTSTFEGAPMTLLEAQSHGLPIVMYDLPYLTLTESRKGVDCVPMNDAAAAAKRIVDWMNDDALFMKKSKEALENAEAFIRIDRAAQWKEILEAEQTERQQIQKGVLPNMQQWFVSIVMEAMEETKRRWDEANWKIASASSNAMDANTIVRTYLYDMGVKQATSLCVRTWMKKILGKKRCRQMREWFEEKRGRQKSAEG